MIIRSRFGFLAKPARPLLLAVAVLALFLLAATRLSGHSDAEGLRLTAEGIRRAAVQCYALEGAYPADFEYLKAHYGLRPDAGKYVVFYQYVASNLMPDVTVLLADAADIPRTDGGLKR